MVFENGNTSFHYLLLFILNIASGDSVIHHVQIMILFVYTATLFQYKMKVLPLQSANQNAEISQIVVSIC